MVQVLPPLQTSGRQPQLGVPAQAVGTFMQWGVGWEPVMPLHCCTHICLAEQVSAPQANEPAVRKQHCSLHAPHVGHGCGHADCENENDAGVCPVPQVHWQTPSACTHACPAPPDPATPACPPAPPAPIAPPAPPEPVAVVHFPSMHT